MTLKLAPLALTLLVVATTTVSAGDPFAPDVRRISGLAPTLGAGSAQPADPFRAATNDPFGAPARQSQRFQPQPAQPAGVRSPNPFEQPLAAGGMHVPTVNEPPRPEQIRITEADANRTFRMPKSRRIIAELSSQNDETWVPVNPSGFRILGQRTVAETKAVTYRVNVMVQTSQGVQVKPEIRTKTVTQQLTVCELEATRGGVLTFNLVKNGTGAAPSKVLRTFSVTVDPESRQWPAPSKSRGNPTWQ